MQPFYTKHGIYLGDFAQAPIEPVRFDALFKRVIGGLYFRHTRGDRLPLEYPLTTLRIMPWDAERCWRSFEGFHLNRCGPYADVFFGACVRAREDPRSTMWWLTFYERVHFAVFAFRPDLDKET